jgi:hypothetical protein
MSKRLLTAMMISATLALAAAAPSALAAPPVVPGAAWTEPVRTETHRARPADRADAQRYAAAERAKPDAAKFEGGASIVIVGSTTAIVLGIILLIVLL